MDSILRPCISFAIVLYHCSAPASASSSWRGATPPGKRAQLHQRHGVQPLLGTPPSCASRCVELLVFVNGRLKQQPLIHTTPIQEYRSSRVRTSGARCLNAKKEKRTRRFANQRFARCHRGAENPQPREVRKREERK